MRELTRMHMAGDKARMIPNFVPYCLLGCKAEDTVVDLST